MIDSDVTLLPEPLSPTIPSVRPLLDAKRNIVDRLHHAVVGVEVGAEMVDFDDGRHA